MTVRLTKAHRIRAYAPFLLFALAQGWLIIQDRSGSPWILVLLYLGIIGAFPFLLVNGVHGDMGGFPGFVGGILYVLVNGSIYYAVFAGLRKVAGRLRSRRVAPKL